MELCRAETIRNYTIGLVHLSPLSKQYNKCQIIV